MSAKWITPFKKQCFVVLGASLNMSQLGMVIGYAAVLLPQLQAAGSGIPVDESSASWIAALPGLSLLLGNLTVPTLMAKLGRRKTSLISIVIVFSAWICLVTAQDITWILIARFFQGLSTGMTACLAPIIIGECTSPKNRGAFSVLMTLIMAAGTLTSHAVGSYATWKTTAFVLAVITLVDLLIVALSPETPSWLADQGRYEDCKRVFVWLRSEEENEELNKLIQSSIITRQSNNINKSISDKIKGYVSTVKKKEYYKPIIIMIHLYAMGQWGGINIFASNIFDIVRLTVGTEVDTALVAITVDAQRVISCVIAVLIIRRIKRRTMLFASCGINALVFLITAGYVYAKTNTELAFDHPIIGIILVHALMMTVAIGSLSLPYTIAGEIFALRYRSQSSGISCFFCSINLFLPVKTFPALSNSIGLHGAYCVYAAIMIYCLFVVWFILPETKDRTLQDIEDDFKGKLVDKDLKAAQPLTVFKGTDGEE